SWDDVARELSAGGGIVDGAADGFGGGDAGGGDGSSLAEQLGEVAGAHEGGGNGDDLGVERLIFAEALVIAEEEETVAQDGAAEGAAEGVALEGKDGGYTGALEAVVGAGIEEAGARELEGRAVEL